MTQHWSTHAHLWRSVLIIAVGMILTFSVYAAFSDKTGVRATHTSDIEHHLVAPSDELEAELITVLPNGLEPKELVRPAGRFVLMFENQSRLQSLEFRLSGSSMPRITELQIGRKLSSTKVLNLSPGAYQVTEVDHPEWSLRLTVTSR